MKKNISISILDIPLDNRYIQKIYNLESAGIQSFQIDVTDGQFSGKNNVDEMKEKLNILSHISNANVDIHLMVNDVQKYIGEFSSYYPNLIYFHIESIRKNANQDNEFEETLKYIKNIYSLGIKAGLVINPETSLQSIIKYLPYINKIMLMTVNPGKGGQTLIYNVLNKIPELKKEIEEKKLDVEIEIDGGVNDKTINAIRKCMPDYITIGSYITKEKNVNDLSINIIKKKIDKIGEDNMLQNTKEMLMKANDNGYSIGAFNITNLETMQGILEASVETNSPVILQTSESAIKYMGINNIYNLVSGYNLDIPIALHLDHGKDFEICKQCIDNGWTSVMIDASSKSFEENVKLTKEVVEYAHERNVTVEAEISALAGIEDDVNISEDNAKYTDPEEAKRFVEETGCDSLAIAIGTSHGAYKFKGEAKLRYDILEQIKKVIPDTPIVLHGASTVIPELVETANEYGGKINSAKGCPDEMLNEAAKRGVSKINVDTDLRLAMTAEIRKFLSNNPENFNPRDYLIKGKEKIKEIVIHKQKNVFMSENKA